MRLLALETRVPPSTRYCSSLYVTLALVVLSVHIKARSIVLRILINDFLILWAFLLLWKLQLFASSNYINLTGHNRFTWYISFSKINNAWRSVNLEANCWAVTFPKKPQFYIQATFWNMKSAIWAVGLEKENFWNDGISALSMQLFEEIFSTFCGQRIFLIFF